MKQDILKKHIKLEPQDFIVKEKIDISIKEDGDFQIFKLKKSNLSTIQVIRFLAHLLKIKPSEIGFAGLKDKYAITTQYISVPKGVNLPEKVCFEKKEKWKETTKPNFGKTPTFCLEKLGHSDKPISVGDNEGNYFEITVKNLNKDLKKRIFSNFEIVKKYGFANYFGEQRFGSVDARNDFIFLHLMKGNIEKALKTYFSIKAPLKNWGNWELFYKDIKGKVEQYEKDLILGLKRGLPFEKAIRILPKNIRLMFNFAFQSFLWNEYLRKYIESKYPYKRVPFINKWKLSFYLEVYDFEYLRNLEIPFTMKKFKTNDKLLKRIIEQTLKKYNVQPDWFEKEIIGIKVLTDDKRKAVCIPRDLKISSKQKDSLKLEFFLPKGSYATVLIRKLFM